MKAIFRFLGLGVVLTGLLAAASTASYAQEACADVDGQTATYTKFTEIYAKKTSAEMKTGLATGKEFLEKYGACETLKEQIDFVKAQTARLEKAIPATEMGEKFGPIFKRFDAGVTSDNADEVYSAGKEILTVQPDNLNIIVPMGVIGLYQSNAANNFKYADDGIRYSTMALSQIKSGKAFNKKNDKGEDVVGVLKRTYTKDQAIGELTYALAYLNYSGKKDKKAALPYYYELSQSGAYKDDPRIYGTIGDYYVEQGAPIGEKIAVMIADRKPEDTPEVLAQKEAAIKAQIALFNGYTERALDAYSRAHKVAKSDTPVAKTYKDNLYKLMQGIYKRRFEKETGLEAYIATTLAKPFPNPTSEVQPISDPEPATTTTTTGQPAAATPASATPATASPASAVKKPVSAVTQKDTVDTTTTAPVKTPAASTVAVKGKAVVKKPVAKKKGKG